MFLDDWAKHNPGTRPGNLGRNTIRADRYDRDRFKRMIEEMRTFDAGRAALCEVVPTGNGLWMDAFMAFVKASVQPVDPGTLQPKYLINARVMADAVELPAYHRLRQWTKGDQVAAAGACIAIRPELEQLHDRAETAEKLAEELEKAMEDLLAAQEEERDLDELIKDWTERQPVMGGCEDPDCQFPDMQEAQAAGFQVQQDEAAAKVAQAQADAEAAEAALEAEMEMVMPGMGAAIRKALERAATEAETLAAMAYMWGVEPGDLIRYPAEKRLKLAQRMNTESFRRMYDLFGPLLVMLTVEQKRKVNNVPEEPFDITMGDNLQRTLMSELMGLGHPILRADFYRRLLEKRLFQWEYQGTEQVGRGGIVCCVDNSQSMTWEDDEFGWKKGDKELWAKAIALCLLHLARVQERKFYGIHFGSKHEIMVFDFSQGYDIEQVMDFAEYFFNGGTDFEAPMDAALTYVRAEFDDLGATESDIVFITDGVCGVTPDWQEQFLSEMERIGATMWGILIGGKKGDEPLRTLCGGRVATVTELLKPDVNLEKVFAGV
jgi:uncharacterized protein with von Willebrand factor type A (vWA) domain